MQRNLAKQVPYFFIFLSIILFLSTHSPNVEYDIDPSYILFGASRPPLYPFFIWLFRWAGQYQFTTIMWVQGLFLFLTLLYARSWLIKKLNLSDFAIFLVCLIVLFTISLRFQILFIQSEGLAFPLFILTFFTFIDCFYHFNLIKIVYLSLLVSLLILTRLQFSYFYIIFFLLPVWYRWLKIPTKQVLLSAIILFGSASFTTLIDHSYHFVKHGFFGVAPYSGLMVLVQTLYLANNNADSYFSNPIEKKIVQQLINQRNHHGLNQDASLVGQLKPSYLNHAYQFYYRNYLAIQDIIDDVLQTSVENTAGKKTNYQANIISFNIYKILILNEPKKNFVFLLWKFIQCMGGIPLFLFFSILLLTLPFKMAKSFTYKFDISEIFVTMITIITFLNAAMIAPFNPDLPVYFCYSQFMFYCLAALLVSRVLWNSREEYVKNSFD